MRKGKWNATEMNQMELSDFPTTNFLLKVRGALGKAKGVQFLVWDVGGQEKLRPLWRSYTRFEWYKENKTIDRDH